jgi:hypothetical protein
MISIGMIILIQWARPLDSNFSNNVETFNEVVSLCTLYLMMCFSDFVADLEIRNQCGTVFIVVLCLYAAVHIFFLVINLCIQIRHFIRRKYYAIRNKRIL